jgi:hypothetical protein
VTDILFCAAYGKAFADQGLDVDIVLGKGPDRAQSQARRKRWEWCCFVSTCCYHCAVRATEIQLIA